MNAVVAALIFLFPSIAFAAEAADQQQWWQVLLLEVIKAALAIAIPVLSVLAAALIRRWHLKVHMDQIQSIAAAAAGWAEQKAAAALKDGAERVPSAQKLATAIQFANGLAEHYKLKEAARRRLVDLIESSLGEQRIIDGEVR